MSNEKLNFAFCWAASCGGCEVAVLDIDDKILDVVDIANIVLWPCAMDFKYDDVAAMDENSIDVCFFNGAIRTSENEEIAKLLGEKSKVMIAFGSCSCFGGIPGLGNVTNKKGTFDYAYFSSPSTVNEDEIIPEPISEVPEGQLSLPEFYDDVRSLDQIVKVDYYLPGCPTNPDLIVDAVEAIAKGELPSPPSTLAGVKTLCDECERDLTEEKQVKEFKRIHEIIPDEEKCLLEQGVICLGPATRSGCGARCIEVNFPCRGCFGPPDNVDDIGAKMVSLLGSIIDSEDEEEIKEIIDDITDPLGTFYSYGLPTSILRRRKME